MMPEISSAKGLPERLATCTTRLQDAWFRLEAQCQKLVEEDEVFRAFLAKRPHAMGIHDALNELWSARKEFSKACLDDITNRTEWTDEQREAASKIIKEIVQLEGKVKFAESYKDPGSRPDPSFGTRRRSTRSPRR